MALSEENGSIRVQVQAGERFNVLIKGGSDKVGDLRLGKTVWLTFESNAVQTL